MATNLTPEARKRQIMIWYVLAAVIGVFAVPDFWSSYSQVETIPYSQFETAARPRQDRRGYGCGGTPSRARSRNRCRRQARILRGPRRSATGRQARRTSGRGQGRAVRRRCPDHPVLGRSGRHLLHDLDVPVSPCRRPPGPRRADDGRQVARQSLRRDRHQGDVQGRRRRRRSEVRAAGGGRVSARSEVLWPAWRAGAERRSAGRSAGDRQDAAGEGGRRRGRRAVLLDFRLGIRRNVRRRRRRARARSVRAGAQGRALHHLHRRARRARAQPHARRLRRHRREGADAQSAPRRARRLRSERRASSCWPRPIGRKSSTRRCCAPDGSIARFWSIAPTTRAASQSSTCTCARYGWRRTSISTPSPG